MKLIAVLLFVQVIAKPLEPPSTKIPSIDAFNFMKRFGYLEEGTSDSEALYSEDAIVDAIKQVQKFGGIPETGVADNATLKLITSPRCGVPDVIRKNRAKRFVLGSNGWKKHHVTYYLSNWTPKLGESAVASNIQKALDAWGKYGRLTFTRVNDPNADIIVVFSRGPHGDSFPFDGPGNILAHAFFPYDQPGYGGDIHFDEDEEWTVHTQEGEDGTDFFTVAVHELGHSLGLSHSPVQNSIMFPYYKGYNPQFSLDYDDVLGMYELYSTPEIASPSEVPSPTTERVLEDGEYDARGSSEEESEDPVWTYDKTTVSHRERNDERRKHERTDVSVPDICDGNYDAIATLRDEMFIFKNKYMWRLRERHRIEEGYPVLISQMFPGLPENIKKIDAAYERPDGMIVLFTGKRYWVYNGQRFVENSPQPLSNYGFSKNMHKLDAVQIWGKNGKTYLFKKDKFWRYNETTKTMDPGYPQNIEKWRGVPSNLDAATTWKDGITYFFKGRLFWKFDNDWVIVSESSPLPTPQTWFGCPEAQYIRDYYSH